MSGLTPEAMELQKRNAELERLEKARRPKKGTLAARLAQGRRHAEKMPRQAEVVLHQWQHACSLHRSDPTLT